MLENPLPCLIPRSNPEPHWDFTGGSRQLMTWRVFSQVHSAATMKCLGPMVLVSAVIVCHMGHGGTHEVVWGEKSGPASSWFGSVLVGHPIQNSMNLRFLMFLPQLPILFKSLFGYTSNFIFVESALLLVRYDHQSCLFVTSSTLLAWTNVGVSENGVYPQWNSHLVGVMISKTIGCRGTLFSDIPKCVNCLALFYCQVHFHAGAAVLDLCSSWISHFPAVRGSTAFCEAAKGWFSSFVFVTFHSYLEWWSPLYIINKYR